MPAQEKLAYKIFQRTIQPQSEQLLQKTANAISVANVPTTFEPSPVQIVCMHGLLGNKNNYTLVGTDLSHGRNFNINYINDSALAAETYIHGVKCRDVYGTYPRKMPTLPSHYIPQLYQTVAFDWRNHGESDHSANFSLDDLAVDLARFLYDYCVSQQSNKSETDHNDNNNNNNTNDQSCCCDSSKCSTESVLKPTPASTSCVEPTSEKKQQQQQQHHHHDNGVEEEVKGPIPIVLLAHSMGAMAMLHWMWMEHIRIWSYKVSHPENPILPFTSFNNMHYNVIGAIVLDMSPSERPASYNDTIKVIHFLQKLPVAQFHSAKEAEVWIVQNLPDHLRWLENDIWQIRYHLTNIDFAHKPHAQWKVGLNEIANGLHLLLWEHGGLRSVQEILKALHQVNKERAEKELPVLERPPLFDAFPTAFFFGEKSKYSTVRSHANVLNHFASPYVVEVKDADHFFFMRKRDKFISLVHQFMHSLSITPAPGL